MRSEKEILEALSECRKRRQEILNGMTFTKLEGDSLFKALKEEESLLIKISTLEWVLRKSF